MAVFHAFRALRPTPEKAADVAALPYDVVNREEAKSIGDENPLSFLHIDRPEMDLEPETDLYDDRVYEKAKENLDKLWIDPYDYNMELREAVLLLADRGIKPYIYNAQLCVLPDDIRYYAQQSISDWKDIYISECDGCMLRGQCAGFFESNRNIHSAHIKKVENISPDISC